MRNVLDLLEAAKAGDLPAIVGSELGREVFRIASDGMIDHVARKMHTSEDEAREAVAAALSEGIDSAGARRVLTLMTEFLELTIRGLVEYAMDVHGTADDAAEVRALNRARYEGAKGA